MKAGVLVVLWAFLTIAPAYGDIALSPLRQVISKQAPAAAFTISNPSSHILEGRVSWVDLAATATGYAPAAAAQRPSLSAAPYLTVAPAHFRLEPGARINVEVRLKKGVKIPRGERRSHLLFEAAAARTSIRKASDNGLQIDISLGVSAPVILRNGGKASAAIRDTRLLRDESGLLVLETTIDPRGDISPYGRIIVRHRPFDGGAGESVLGVRENVAGFLDGPGRRFEIPLGRDRLTPGELEIRYEGRAEFAGRLFDRRVFDVAPSQ